MKKTNPDFACLYFHASWNPSMKKINAEHEKICFKNPTFKHIWIDTDKHPRIKYYYDVKMEPCFSILINGGELERITGDDFPQLEKVFKR